MMARIGKYEILERIATGGQGTVYRALDPDLDRVVAIKIITQPVTDDSLYLGALQREARLASSLNHINILPDLTVEIPDADTTQPTITGATLIRDSSESLGSTFTFRISATDDTAVSSVDINYKHTTSQKKSFLVLQYWHSYIRVRRK